MELGLFQTQSTNLVMTTELQQAITLLQYTTVELAQFIQEIALENPLIELEEDRGELDIRETLEWPNNKKRNNLEPTNSTQIPLPEKPSLQEHLFEQVRWLPITEIDKTVLKFLILNLDDNGYLIIDSEDAAEFLNIDSNLVKENITRLQTMDPIGVGARDLKECLLIQLNAFQPNNHIAIKIVTDYLELLAQKNWKKLMQELQLSPLEVKEAVASIQSLNPKPCINISNIETRYIIPDIIIQKDNEGYIVSLNNKLLPSIHLNNHYMEMLKSQYECSNYLHDKYHQYKWLTRSIEQRRETILKVVKAFIQKQQSFLESGLSSLKPLTLKDIAVEINMHESTVSRSVKNKIIQTPIGTFEMHKLFTSKLVNKDGSQTSSTKAKLLINNIIENENKEKPLSDQKIVNLLKENYQISISRRTVTKYREELGILSSNLRKEII